MKKLKDLAGISLLVAMSFASFAQKNVKISWGDEFELPKKSVELGFIGNSKIGYTEVSHAYGKAINLQKFSPSLKYTGLNSVPTKSFPKGYMIEEMGVMDMKNYLYYSTWNKKEGVEKLYAQEIDAVKGEFKGSPKELLSSGAKLSGTLTMTGFYQFNTAGKWNFVTSADSSKLLVYYRIKPKEKRDAINKDVIGLFVFDKNLNKIWGNEVEMPYTEKMMDNDDYQVDGKGNVYILAKVYTGDKKDKQSHYEVLMYNKESSKKPSISSFKFTDKTVVDIALTEDLKGRMLCAGYYSKSGAGSDGAFFFAYDEGTKTMKNLNKGFYEFPTELLREFESKRAKKKSEKKEAKGQDEEVSHLSFRDIELDDDGSMTLYGEQYTWWITISYSGRSTTTTYHYLFDDIYVMKIGADGEMKWVKKIPKAQRGSTQNVYAPDRLGLGFHVHKSGPDSYLFFVDNIKNLDIKKDEAPAAHVAGAGGVLMCVKIKGDDGTVTKSNIFDFREEKMNVEVRKFSDVSEKEVLGRARKLKGPFQMNFQKGKVLMLTVN
jgi:hypothetical protein